MWITELLTNANDHAKSELVFGFADDIIRLITILGSVLQTQALE